jgi:gliding motility-associated-like protein
MQKFSLFTFFLAIVIIDVVAQSTIKFSKSDVCDESAIAVKLPNACGLMVNAGPDITICQGQGKILNASVVGGNAPTLEWQSADGLDDPTKLKPTANPSVTTTYTLTARAMSNELIVNGGLEGGISPSTTSYNLVGWMSLPTSSNSNYSIFTYPQISSQFGCSTRGANSMVCHGSGGVGQNFWCQTIAVNPGRDYKFSFWIMSVFNFFFTPNIVMKINNVTITSGATSGICSWDEVSGVWNSGGNTSATICFANSTNGAFGNAFAFDDVSFKECCEEKDDVKVTVYEIEALITDPEEINCKNRPLTIDGSASKPSTGVTYEWSTTNGKIIGPTNMSKVQIDAPGNYKLKVKGQYGCEAEKEVTVNGSVKPPSLQAKATAIKCIPGYGVIEANSVVDYEYNWEGPNNFMSNRFKENVLESGQYFLTVTDGFGCTNTASVFIQDQRNTYSILIKGDTITCSKDSILLNANVALKNMNYTWKYPNGTTKNNSNIFTQDTGWHFVTAIDSIGCIAKDSFYVIDYKKNLPIKFKADTLNCKQAEIRILLISDTSGTVTWAGPNSFSSHEFHPKVKESGWYYVNILTKDACTGFDSVFVFSDFTIPDIANISNDTLTCAKKSINKLGISVTPNVIYEWRLNGLVLGRNSNIDIIDSGNYILHVIAPNGCYNEQQFNILKNTNPPVFSVVDDTLNCRKKSVNLYFKSTEKFSQILWKGPNAFQSSDSSFLTSNAGTYSIEVTGLNGCTDIKQIEISLDTAKPNLIFTVDTISCKSPVVVPKIVPDSNNISFVWRIQNNIISNTSQVMLTQGGLLEVEIEGKNGCKNNYSQNVFEDKKLPLSQLSADTIKCNSTAFIESIPLSDWEDFTWTGPNNFSSKKQKEIVTSPGLYYLEIIGKNGCRSLDSIRVIQKDILPNIFAKDDTITCAKSIITLDGGSSTSGVTFSWIGPNGFKSSIANPTVKDSGIYTLFVTDMNGCVATKEIRIIKIGEVPEVFIIANDSILTCKNDTVVLNYSTGSAQHNIKWTGPNNFASTNKIIKTTIPGTYSLELINEYGCITTTSKTITENKIKPIISVKKDTITCVKNSLNQVLVTNDTGLTIKWTGPNGFSSNLINPTIIDSGTYQISAENIFGCKEIFEVYISKNVNIPFVKVTGDSITCKQSFANLMASNFNSSFILDWDGPNGFKSNKASLQVNEPGLYACIITDPENGCFYSDIFEVKADTNRIKDIGLEVINETCNGSNGKICLCNILGGKSPYLFSIDGGQNFKSNFNFTNLKSGNYPLLIKDDNDCLFTDTAIIYNEGALDFDVDSILYFNKGESRNIDLTFKSPKDKIKLISWSPSDQLNCDQCEVPVITANFNQDIFVEIEDIYGCSLTRKIRIVVNDQNEIYFPNAVSFNDDGLNDIFFPVSKNPLSINYLRIYNRWGELLFENKKFSSNDKEAGWNGYYRNKMVNPGVYIYTIEYIQNDIVKRISSDFTVLK